MDWLSSAPRSYHWLPNTLALSRLLLCTSLLLLRPALVPNSYPINTPANLRSDHLLRCPFRRSHPLLLSFGMSHARSSLLSRTCSRALEPHRRVCPSIPSNFPAPMPHLRK